MSLDLLRTVPFLRQLTESELHLLYTLVQVQEFPAGAKIVAEGEPINALHLVYEGTVHVRRRAQKREVLLGRIGPRGFFGEVNLFDQQNATASIFAMSAATIASVDYAALRSFMETNPAAGYKIVSALMAEVCQRLRQTNDRFVNAVYWQRRNEASGE